MGYNASSRESEDQVLGVILSPLTWGLQVPGHPKDAPERVPSRKMVTNLQAVGSIYIE